MKPVKRTLSLKLVDSNISLCDNLTEKYEIRIGVAL